MRKTLRYFRNQEAHRAPPIWLTGFEGGRFAIEAAALQASRNYLLENAEVDAHPVLVFPGLFASDRTTVVLRRFLTEAGYPCSGWERGTNLGPTRDEDLEQAIEELIDRLYQSNGRQKLSLIGWSLGGLYARMAAHMAPDKVRQVITLGSPVNGNPEFTNAWRLYEWVSGMEVDASENLEKLALVQKPLPVPSTSIYSKTDSIVAWQISLAADGPQQQNVHVAASHIGMAFNPLVFDVILDRLAQAEGRWQPFQSAGLKRFLYA